MLLWLHADGVQQWIRVVGLQSVELSNGGRYALDHVCGGYKTTIINTYLQTFELELIVAKLRLLCVVCCTCFTVHCGHSCLCE